MRWMACALLATASGSALAQDVSGAYVGATFGNLTYTEKADGLVSQSSFDDSSSTYRLYGGYRLGLFPAATGFRQISPEWVSG